MTGENASINGVILQKLQSLDLALTELRSLGKLSVQTLNNDWRTRRAADMVNRCLPDFERFRSEILNYVRR